MFSIKMVLGLAVIMVTSTIAGPLPETDDMTSHCNETSLTDDYEIIGYRTVKEPQAKKYNDAGTITDDANLIGTQIGPGTYTIPYLGGWPGTDQDWYCVIAAHKYNFGLYTKAWIPEYLGKTRLWDSKGDEIGKYIQKLDSSWSIPTTFRMSLIEGYLNALQMVIPRAALNQNGGKLGIKAQCLKKTAIRGDLPVAWRPVNYRTWTNVKGAVQGSPPEASDKASYAKMISIFIKLLRSEWSQMPLRVRGDALKK